MKRICNIHLKNESLSVVEFNGIIVKEKMDGYLFIK